MQFFITAIVVVTLLDGVVSSCSSVCYCINPSDEPIVDCSRRRLDSIPTDLPDITFSL